MRKIKKCKPSPRLFKLIQSSDKRKHLLYHFIYGWQSGISLCCILWFCYKDYTDPDCRIATEMGCMEYNCEWACCPSCAKKYHIEENKKITVSQGNVLRCLDRTAYRLTRTQYGQQ